MSRIQKILLTAALVLLFAHAGAAQTNHGDFIGTNITFEDVTETSTFGDPEPLWGAPLVLGDQLLFFPTNYSASAAGVGGFDQTGALLQATLRATTGTLTTFTLTEFGDTTLTGIGTPTTGTFAGIGGQLTVLEVNGAPIIPVVINLPPDDATFLLPSDPGITNWSLTTTVDIAASVPNATLAILTFDNNLFASSEDGTGASIQKKVVSGPSLVISVPEPAALALAFVAALGLAIRRRA